MRQLRRLFAGGLAVAFTFGTLTLLAPDTMAGRGNGNGGGGGPGGGGDDDCPCEEVINPAPGVVCTLDWCVEYVPGGYECGYTCTLPF